MAKTSFKGPGYTGDQETVHITEFVIGPMPPRARLFNPEAQKKYCTAFHEVARTFLISQDYLKEGPGVQELIPGVEVEPEPAKEPMTTLLWHTGFHIRMGELFFEVELRTSEKLPTRARKLIGETLSKAFKACVGSIERHGGPLGDLASADALITLKTPETPRAPSSDIPEIT